MSENVKQSKMNVIRLIFRILVVAVLSYFLLGEIFLQKETNFGGYDCKEYNDGWYQLKEDGTKIYLDIPCECDAKRNEDVTFENILPKEIKDNVYLCFRSSKQEMSIYIDGVLREEYSTKDTRLFGKTSAVAFVFVELTPDDSGKIITVKTKTDSSYTGILYNVYYGDKTGIWGNFFKQYGIELITGFFMLILGILCIIFSIVLNLYFHKQVQLENLGWGVFLAAIWVITNSMFRQVIFSNISVVGDMTFLMIMLLAIPFMLYMDDIQRQRYHKIYLVGEGIVIVDFFVCTILHITNTVDFADSIKVIAVICFSSISTMVITMIVDVFNGRVKEYLLVAVGVLGISIAAVIQIYIYFYNTIKFNGTIISIGLIFLLICSVINELKNIQYIEKEKQLAISSNVSKGKFLANMSHEIRTPINVVLGMDSMILRESKDKKIKEYALDIQNAGQTLLSLINDILDFSKIESGKMEIIPVEYDFSSILLILPI